MITQNNLNNQSFNGRVVIVDELSAVPCQRIRRIVPQLKTIIENKPFDLFVKENYEHNSVDFIAQKANHFGKNNKPASQIIVAKHLTYYNENSADEFYVTMAKHAVDNYETNFPEKKSTLDNFKNFIKNIFKK